MRHERRLVEPQPRADGCRSAEDNGPAIRRSAGRTAETAVLAIDIRLPCARLALTRTSCRTLPRGPAQTVIGKPTLAQIGSIFYSDTSATRRRLAERELALREAEIESRMKELWWTPPRMIAFAMAAGVLIVLFGMGVGVLLHHM
jgi:hypothetical protein